MTEKEKVEYDRYVSKKQNKLSLNNEDIQREIETKRIRKLQIEYKNIYLEEIIKEAKESGVYTYDDMGYYINEARIKGFNRLKAEGVF